MYLLQIHICAYNLYAAAMTYLLLFALTCETVTSKTIQYIYPLENISKGKEEEKEVELEEEGEQEEEEEEEDLKKEKGEV